MNKDLFFEEIKNKLMDNEAVKYVKRNAIRKKEITTFYEVGKLLNEAIKLYGDDIIKIYADILINDIGINYEEDTLRKMIQFYNFINNK